MHYIRFVKPPRLETEKDGPCIKALITLTSDLSDGFYPLDAQICIDLVSSNTKKDCAKSHVFQQKTSWQPGMRTLPIACTIPADWPLKKNLKLALTPSHAFRPRPLWNDGTLVMQPLVGVESAQVQLSKGEREAERKMLRVVSLVSQHEPPLCVWEEMGETIAGHVWNAGVATTAFTHCSLLHSPRCFPLLENALAARQPSQVRVLELGAGCGILGLGIARALRGCEVVLTDLPHNEYLASCNIEAFQAQHQEQNRNPAKQEHSRVSFQALNWKEPLPDSLSNHHFDLFIASDVTYNFDSTPFLVGTISSLVQRSPQALTVISMKFRHSSEQVFFELMGEAGFMIADRARVLAPITDFPDGSMPDADEIDIYAFTRS